MNFSTFFYFAYGSNLLAERIHINNPTAIRRAIGFLKDYRLDFNNYSKRWKGSPATIVPTNGKIVWGAIWEINTIDLPNLDNQEGVADGLYFPLQVDIEKPDGTIKKCRTYQLCKNPDDYVEVWNLPMERQPSAKYMTTVINGAIESGINPEYISFLRSVKHNIYNGTEINGIS